MGKKRGQLLSQPFIFIFILVVIAITIVFGADVIRKVLVIGEDVELIRFKESLKQETNLFYNLDPGSIKNLELPVPMGITYVCFVDRDKELSLENVPDGDTTTLIGALKDKNMFFITNARDRPQPINIRYLKPEGENPLCIKTPGILRAKIEARGKYVSISKI